MPMQVRPICEVLRLELVQPLVGELRRIDRPTQQAQRVDVELVRDIRVARHRPQSRGRALGSLESAVLVSVNARGVEEGANGIDLSVIGPGAKDVEA